MKIDCKVTHFLSITQAFLKKTDFCVHTQGVFVQLLVCFLGVLYTLLIFFRNFAAKFEMY